jgi:uncharacterized membrane protein HdeD (DUF308 family)
MELKYYDKAWQPAFKGAFLIAFGLAAILQVMGSIRTVGVFCIALIGMTAAMQLANAFLNKKLTGKGWLIITGLINLAIAIWMSLNVMNQDLELARAGIVKVIFVWIILTAIFELAEAINLFKQKNGFGALFILNVLFTLLFGYFLYIVFTTPDVKPQGVMYLGIIALTIGISNELSAYLLSVVKK